MKILIAPMNWGLGHATRCIPLIDKYIKDKAEVVIAGDGESFTLLKKRYPQLRAIPLAPLNLKYSAHNQQVGAMLLSIPKITWWAIKDHYILKGILATEHFDRVISDNRFGCYLSIIPENINNPRPTQTVYITHQLMIKMPWWLRWLEPIMAAAHRHLIKRYSQCWIPDSAGPDNLSGDLSHKYKLPLNARFIGNLSRFTSYIPTPQNTNNYHTVAILSGLEPQRTILENQIISIFQKNNNQLSNSSKTSKASKSAQRSKTSKTPKSSPLANITPQYPNSLLIIRGKINDPLTTIKQDNITLLPYIDDQQLVPILLNAKHIIARSGYTTIMDLNSINCLHKTTLIPTPGQTEQEYLAKYINSKTHKTNSTN